MERGAILSPCGRYRYYLWRHWNTMFPRKVMTCIMLNPSTADHEKDDPTIRRCIGFAKSEGYNSLRVLNLFALRSSSPLALHTVDDPVGKETDNYILPLTDADKIVLAWGSWNSPAIKERVEAVLDMLAGRNLWCFGKNADGSPKHPLYLPGNTRLVRA